MVTSLHVFTEVVQWGIWLKITGVGVIIDQITIMHNITINKQKKRAGH